MLHGLGACPSYRKLSSPASLGHGKFSRAYREPAFGLNTNGPRLCTGGHGCRDLGVRVHGELGRHAVPKADTLSLGQARSCDRHYGSDRPAGRVEIQNLWSHPEDLRTGQSATRSRHGYSAGGCATRDLGLQVGIGDDGEAGRGAIERHFARPGESLSQDGDGCPDLA